jgi:cell division septation protein DedD
MTHRFSKIFIMKTVIFSIFILTALIVSFFLGRQFGYYMMGDLQNEEKLKSAVEQAKSGDDKYSPLASPRFKYNADKFPTDEYGAGAVQRPDEGQVVQQSVDVQMNYVPDDQNDDSNGVLDLGEDNQTAPQVDQPPAPSEDQSIESNVVYKVLVGTYKQKENAEAIYTKLRDENYDPYIEAVVKDSETVYRVQIGAFKNIDNANSLAEELRKKGYNAWTHVAKD